MTAMKTSSVKSAVKLADADVSMETSGKRTGLVFLLTFLLLAAGIIGVGMFYYRSHAKQQRAEVGQQLSAIADLKVVELTQWRKERLGYANLLFQNAAFSVVVQRFFESPDDADAQHQLQTWLDKFAANMGYDRIRLLDAQGVTRLSSPIGLPTASAVVVEFAAKARQSGRVLLQDFYRSEQTQKISLGLLVPIFDEQETSRALGVLDLRIDPHVYLYPFLQRWPTPSPSAETLLVRREGNEVLFLNELRFQTNTTLNLRIPLDRLTLPAVQAVNGQESLVEGIDYRGVPVLAAVRTVPDSPWALVARIDESEVYAPLNGLLWQVGVMVVALLFGVGTCVGLLWRRQRIRFYQERAESAEVLRDITDRKLALEEASRMATQLEAANKELEAFSYSVSHDLRAPLRAIDGYGRILVEDYTERLDDEGRRVLAVISSETRRMGQLIDDLLAFSRLGRQKLEMSEINMTTLAQAVFEEQLAQAPERNLQVDLKPMSPAYGDRAMLRVVFTNLISNAIKFTKHCDPAQIEIGSRNEDGQVVYYVKDNGAGFDMKYASKLFGVFQRLHSTEEFEGTGVGLALIQSVIRHHGGRIWAEAKVNEGATFTFALPNKKGK